MLSGCARNRVARSYSGKLAFESSSSAASSASEAEAEAEAEASGDWGSRRDLRVPLSAPVKKKNWIVRGLSFRETVLRKDM